MRNKDSKDENFFQDILSTIRSSLNTMFNTILNELSISFWQAILIIILEYVQSLYFIFCSPSKFDWSFDTMESGIRVLSKITLIWPYFAENNTTVLFMIFHLCGAFLICILACFIFFISVKVKKKSLIRITVIWIIAILLLLIQTILYLPLASILFNDFSHVYTNYKLFRWNESYNT